MKHVLTLSLFLTCAMAQCQTTKDSTLHSAAIKYPYTLANVHRGELTTIDSNKKESNFPAVSSKVRKIMESGTVGLFIPLKKVWKHWLWPWPKVQTSLANGKVYRRGVRKEK